jgi:hypothetical protein
MQNYSQIMEDKEGVVPDSNAGDRNIWISIYAYSKRGEDTSPISLPIILFP